MSSTNVFEPVVHRPFTKTEDDGKDAGSQFVHSSFNIFGVVGAVGIAVDDLDGEGTGASVTDDVDDGLEIHSSDMVHVDTPRTRRSKLELFAKEFQMATNRGKHEANIEDFGGITRR